jgi:PD-(D/E)XK endonuclease
MAPQRSWTDEALIEAVKAARSWRAVQRELGLNTTSVTHGLKRRADQLKLNYTHFTGQRRWTDADLRAAVGTSTTWVEVARRVGRSALSGSGAEALKRHAERLGLDTSHLNYSRSGIPLPGQEIPFSNTPSPNGKSGLSIAAKWFLDRGYAVSVPLEPTCYDLIVESDEGLKKIQVKTTNRVESSGRYGVRLTRTIYDPLATSKANGKYRQAPYAPGMVDYFFIVTGSGGMYLIPFDVIGSRQSIVLDHKYGAFTVT